MFPTAHGVSAHGNSGIVQSQDADVIPAPGVKRGAGADEARASKRQRRASGSMSPARDRILHAQNGPPRVADHAIGLVEGHFKPTHRQDLSLAQRVRLFVTLLRNIFSKDALFTWKGMRYETPDRDTFAQLLDHLHNCKTLTATDMENLRGSLKGPVAMPGSDYLARIAAGHVNRMDDIDALRLLKDQLVKLQGGGAQGENDGFSVAGGNPVEPGVTPLGKALSADMDKFCRSVLEAVSGRLDLAHARADLENKRAGIDRCMSELAANLAETNRDVYENDCEKLLSALNSQVGAFADASAAAQKLPGSVGQESRMPALALDRTVLDRALLKFFGDAAVTDAYPSDPIGATPTLVLNNGVAWQEALVERLDQLVPYSTLLTSKVSELAWERYAAHEAAGAQAISDIMESIPMSAGQDEQRDLPSLAGKLRRVLNVIRYTTGKREELLDRSETMGLPDLPDSLVAAFRDRDDLETLWRELGGGVSKLYAEMSSGREPGVVRHLLPTDAHQMLGWLSELIGDSGNSDGENGRPMRAEDERAWRDALVSEMGLVVGGRDERVLPQKTLRLQEAFRASSEGAMAANNLKPEDWLSWGADPESSRPKHGISKFFRNDVIVRPRYGLTLRGVDSNGERVVASTLGGPGKETEVDDFLAAMERVRPGSVRQLMPYLDQGQAFFVQGGLSKWGANIKPTGNGYSSVSFEIDMRPNGDTLMEIEVRYDAMSDVIETSSLGVVSPLALDPAQSSARFRKCILVSRLPDGQANVRQLGPVAFSMKAVPLAQAPAAPVVADVLDESWEMVG